jgi:hypothetical protein
MLEQLCQLRVEIDEAVGLLERLLPAVRVWTASAPAREPAQEPVERVEGPPGHWLRARPGGSRPGSGALQAPSGPAEAVGRGEARAAERPDARVAGAPQGRGDLGVPRRRPSRRRSACPSRTDRSGRLVQSAWRRSPRVGRSAPIQSAWLCGEGRASAPLIERLVRERLDQLLPEPARVQLRVRHRKVTLCRACLSARPAGRASESCRDQARHETETQTGRRG